MTSIGFLALMIVGATTPIVWELTGRPSESYPELVFTFIGLPFALLLLLTASANFWWKNRK